MTKTEIKLESQAMIMDKLSQVLYNTDYLKGVPKRNSRRSAKTM